MYASIKAINLLVNQIQVLHVNTFREKIYSNGSGTAGFLVDACFYFLQNAGIRRTMMV
jgi:hypothetical protein